MRRDSIFYSLFNGSPSLLFDLLAEVPDSADRYRFESVAVKEPTFTIDGVFLPPESDPPGVVFYAEVQMQKDERLYERMFGESMAHFYRNRDYYSDWQAVVIYSSRSMEQTDTHPYRALLNSDQVHRIYLNELGAIETLPLGVAAMVLTIVKESEAPEKARMLLRRASQEVSSLPVRQGIIEVINTIISYKFTKLSRKEIDAMLGTKFEETRVFQEAQEDKAKAIALKMLRKSMSLETIADITDLTIAQLQELQAQVS
ncbi:MAG: Rpn family recombination-promoting nuclease/putative transposase [Alkalinema sp. RU_4_3]|nr:Rpn family recombination-promoting nuclease/putative transposase [Alkalinema sp. RU_4_3]